MEPLNTIIPRYEIVITDPTIPPVNSVYLEENLVYVNRAESQEVLEIFATKEIYYAEPEYMAGKFFGTYSSSLSEGKTYFIDSKGTTSGYTNVVL